MTIGSTSYGVLGGRGGLVGFNRFRRLKKVAEVNLVKAIRRVECNNIIRCLDLYMTHVEIKKDCWTSKSTKGTALYKQGL